MSYPNTTAEVEGRKLLDILADHAEEMEVPRANDDDPAMTITEIAVARYGPDGSYGTLRNRVANLLDLLDGYGILELGTYPKRYFICEPEDDAPQWLINWYENRYPGSGWVPASQAGDAYRHIPDADSDRLAERLQAGEVTLQEIEQDLR